MNSVYEKFILSDACTPKTEFMFLNDRNVNGSSGTSSIVQKNSCVFLEKSVSRVRLLSPLIHFQWLKQSCFYILSDIIRKFIQLAYEIDP